MALASSRVRISSACWRRSLTTGAVPRGVPPGHEPGQLILNDLFDLQHGRLAPFQVLVGYCRQVVDVEELHAVYVLSFGIDVARDGEVEEEQVALAAGSRLGDHLPCHDEVGRVGGRYYDVRLRERRADLGEWDGPAAQALCQVLSPLEGPVGKSQIGQPSGAQGLGDELARLSRTY